MNPVQPQNLQSTAGIYPVQQDLSAVQVPVQKPPQVSDIAPVPQNICYPPQYYYGMPNYAMSNYPRASVGAVEINIHNPTVNSGPAYSTQPTYCMPPVPVQQAQVQPIQSQSAEDVPPSAVQEQEEKPAAEKLKKEEPRPAEPKKQVVQLTDQYIRTLENYLKNPNADVRLLGIKEVLNRLKEDDSRRNDQALTNLVNKALRDSSQSVRLIALSAVGSDVLEGDKLTYKILQDMQKSDAAYNQDSVTAAEIMLKKAGRKLSVQSKPNSEPLQDSQSQPGQNLNLMAE